jgi:hypothetical protein
MTSLICKKANFKTRCENSAPIQAKRKRKIRKWYRKCYAKRCEKNEAKQSEIKRNFCLFVSQTEAKIMRNGLRFASISHEAKKKFKRKRDTLPPISLSVAENYGLRNPTCLYSKDVASVQFIDISWIDELRSLLPGTSCIVDSAAIYIMVAKFRNTICPPPPQLSLHTRAALSSNSNGTRFVNNRKNPKSSLYCEVSMVQ